MAVTLQEMATTWLQGVGSSWHKLCGFALAALALAFAVQALRGRLQRHALAIETVALAIVVAVGVHRAAQEAWLADDAFISFRYARNWADGHGLVWNLGERVEGYTNFLWTLGMGLLIRLGLGEAPEIGLFGSLAAFAVCLVVVHRLARLLAAQAGLPSTLPIASAWLALQSTFVSFGTSGLETSTASLLVVAGAFFVVRLRGRADAALAGTCFALGTLTRPDHVLFYAGAALVLLVSVAPPIARARVEGAAAIWRAGADRIAAFCLPSLMIALHLAWRLSYYGDWVPNTYHAKSADLTYYSQGIVYAASFYLGSQLLFLVPVVLVWACVPALSAVTQRFKLLLLVSFVLYNVYVMRVGGDFMFGRFFVSLLPLFALAAGQLIVELLLWTRGTQRVLGYAWVAALAASTVSIRMLPAEALRWQMADEGTYFRVSSWRPVVVNHGSFLTGQQLAKLRANGIEPILATSGVGMVGYYSQLEVVDLVGLVDAHVAHQSLARRGRPGHEKYATLDYLQRRGVHFVRDGFVEPRFSWITAVGLRPAPRWHMLKYDAELIDRIKRADPGIRFTDIPQLLDRRYPPSCRVIGDPKRVQEDLRFFESYYFAHNHDPERYRRLKDTASAYAMARSAGPFAHLPAPQTATGRRN